MFSRDLKRKNLLIANSKKHFTSLNWTVGSPANQTDFCVRKNKLVIFINCIPNDVLEYQSLNIINTDIDRWSAVFRVRRLCICHVLDDNFQDSVPKYLLSRGIVAVNYRHLTDLEEVGSLSSNLPQSLENISELVLDGNVALQLDIAERFDGSGDLENAIVWACRAYKTKPDYIPSAVKSINLLMRVKNYDKAYELASDALSVTRESAILAKKLYDISLIQKNYENIQKWQAVLKNLTPQPANNETSAKASKSYFDR